RISAVTRKHVDDRRVLRPVRFDHDIVWNDEVRRHRRHVPVPNGLALREAFEVSDLVRELRDLRAQLRIVLDVRNLVGRDPRIAKRRVPVLIARDQDDAEALYRDLAFMLGTTDERAAEEGLLFFGADEKSPYEEYSPDGRAVMERINTLYRLTREKDKTRAVV